MLRLLSNQHHFIVLHDTNESLLSSTANSLFSKKTPAAYEELFVVFFKSPAYIRGL